MSDHYDVIIIGTGAGGGTLAHTLAPSGKRILLLERGGYLPREPENWDSEEVFGRERYVTSDTWIDKNGARFRPHAQYYVGGNTKFYGAILFRLRERDFGEVHHYGGVSPAWPIDYAAMEPYYTEAEKLYLVHGQAGEDPSEPPRSGPFPYPAVSHEPRIQQLHDDFARTGHHRSTCRSAWTSTSRTPRPAAACAAIASTASPAWPTARPMPTSSAYGPR
jgi:choline dehydrogenase-like flavoprotein